MTKHQSSYILSSLLIYLMHQSFDGGLFFKSFFRSSHGNYFSASADLLTGVHSARSTFLLRYVISVASRTFVLSVLDNSFSRNFITHFMRFWRRIFRPKCLIHLISNQYCSICPVELIAFHWFVFWKCMKGATDLIIFHALYLTASSNALMACAVVSASRREYIFIGSYSYRHLQDRDIRFCRSIYFTIFISWINN